MTLSSGRSVRDHEPLGLRERKKVKTRAAIQEHALRLFAEQGYDETTVDQIAEAAEVSPSTFFRYFPTKEDVVLHDRYDPLMLAAFQEQPPELGPIAAMRAAMRSVFGRLSDQELGQERLRGALIMSVPELRARSLDQMAGALADFSAAVAARLHRPPDAAIRNLIGAVFGVCMAALVSAFDDPDVDYLELMDEALAHLEAGLPV
jgi:AcrR family transcriptional regulator